LIPTSTPACPCVVTVSPSSVTRAPGWTGSDGSWATAPSTDTRPLRTSPSTPRRVPRPASARYRLRRVAGTGRGPPRPRAIAERPPPPPGVCRDPPARDTGGGVGRSPAGARRGVVQHLELGRIQ